MRLLSVTFISGLLLLLLWPSSGYGGVDTTLTTGVSVDALSETPPGSPDTASYLPFFPVELPAIEKPKFTDLRIEVSIRMRELYVVSEDKVVATYPVAVGKPEWPTRRGQWGIHQVVWNPWWHPPDQEWARNFAIMAPGDPDNPMGRAQLVYDAPRSIHGTIDPSSIGKAVSHGSIRVSNETAMKLARQIMEYSGIERDEEWFENIRRDRFTNVRFQLPEPVPIYVY
ncbi:L,D-transpeptidase [Balneolales bacterium ANBcel1]|nr:L,D-transpeptidase [Balneolales bacterium ANBcel1]